jgi:hypothetical protein
MAVARMLRQLQLVLAHHVGHETPKEVRYMLMSRLPSEMGT